MNYRITPITVDGFPDADGVYENRAGAWLGQIDDGAVWVPIDPETAALAQRLMLRHPDVESIEALVAQALERLAETAEG